MERFFGAFIWRYLFVLCHPVHRARQEEDGETEWPSLNKPLHSQGGRIGGEEERKRIGGEGGSSDRPSCDGKKKKNRGDSYLTF